MERNLLLALLPLLCDLLRFSQALSQLSVPALVLALLLSSVFGFVFLRELFWGLVEGTSPNEPDVNLWLP